MNKEECEKVEDFYKECAKHLNVEIKINPIKPVVGVDRHGRPRTTNRNRWGPRNPGNGRFDGFGLIRVYGNKVHVSLYRPILINKLFDSKEEFIDFLTKLNSN